LAASSAPIRRQLQRAWTSAEVMAFTGGKGVDVL
jgi:hypothetical protein